MPSSRSRLRGAAARRSRGARRLPGRAEGIGGKATVLRFGASGQVVARLQRRPSDLGFSPGALDGDFGPATLAAVLAFQKSEGLLAESDVQLGDKPIVLVALATIRTETESFEPISEGLSRFNTSPSGIH